ncbi:MAG TPA: hypothetical protein VJR27_02685 [Candidatus Saccharimonadales bacterium]|nr:hypothetical protein [Candidatus Saccharimonadales bacterium]
MSGELPPTVPEHCYLVKASGLAALQSLCEYPGSRVCSAEGCELLGRDFNVDYGVGLGTVTVKQATQLREPAEGCPREGRISYETPPAPNWQFPRLAS